MKNTLDGFSGDSRELDVPLEATTDFHGSREDVVGNLTVRNALQKKKEPMDDLSLVLVAQFFLNDNFVQGLVIHAETLIYRRGSFCNALFLPGRYRVTYDQSD